MQATASHLWTCQVIQPSGLGFPIRKMGIKFLSKSSIYNTLAVVSGTSFKFSNYGIFVYYQ